MTNVISSTLALPPALRAHFPHYLLISDGLIISQQRATAWFTITPASTQLFTPADTDHMIAQAAISAREILSDYDIHIKTIWSTTDANEYRAHIEEFTSEDGQAWQEARATAVESWQLPQRRVLLGVDIENRTDTLITRAITKAKDWIGIPGGVPRSEYKYLDTIVRSLGARLERTLWKATPTPVNVLSWMLSREVARTHQPTVDSGPQVGAAVARVQQGRLVPWRDHVRVYDTNGQEVAYRRHFAITTLPEHIDTTYAQWLLAVANIHRPSLDDPGRMVDVLADADVRLRIDKPAQSLKRVEKTRRSAKEQRREAAKTSAEETSRDIAMSEADMIELAADIRRGGVTLTSLWATLTLTEPTFADLEASSLALIETYANMGIAVEVLDDQQAEAWAQGLPCDQVRIEDYYHVTDIHAAMASFFWGASIVGEPGPIIGYTTGATKTPVGFHPTTHPRLGDSATTVAVGKSGRGKTTTLQTIALDAASVGGWVSAIDYKGDLNSENGGLVQAARMMGLPAVTIDLGAQHGGACDLLALMDDEDALIHSHSQLMLLISQALRTEAAPVLMDAINHVLRTTSRNQRNSAVLIEYLLTHAGDIERRIGKELEAYQGDSLGRLIVAKPSSAPPLGHTPGIYLLSLPKVDLPDAHTPMSEWSLSQRVSAAVARGILAWQTTMSRSEAMRHIPKLTIVPEAHLLTANSESASFLVKVSRMGRAYNHALALDTQDPTTLAAHEGIIEQISTVFAFSQSTRTGQAATARLLGLEADEATLNMIAQVSVNIDGSVWHGHCLMKDRTGQVATVQIAIPTPEIAEALSTTPRSRQ